jgi:hypothetical protein
MRGTGERKRTESVSVMSGSCCVDAQLRGITNLRLPGHPFRPHQDVADGSGAVADQRESPNRHSR